MNTNYHKCLSVCKHIQQRMGSAIQTALTPQLLVATADKLIYNHAIEMVSVLHVLLLFIWLLWKLFCISVMSMIKALLNRCGENALQELEYRSFLSWKKMDCFQIIISIMSCFWKSLEFMLYCMNWFIFGTCIYFKVIKKYIIFRPQISPIISHFFSLFCWLNSLYVTF